MAPALEAIQSLSRRAAYVFSLPGGKRLHPDSYLEPLKRAAKRAGMNKRVDLHMLRHSYGSNKLRQGWGLKKVSVLLGHASTEITAKIYAHLLDGDLRVRDEYVSRTLIDSTNNETIDSSNKDALGVLAEKLTESFSKTEAGRIALLEFVRQLDQPQAEDGSSVGKRQDLSEDVVERGDF